MGGKPKSTSTNSSASGSAQAWAQPLATAGANNVLSVYNANQPGLEATTGQVRNQLTGQQQQGQQFGQTAGHANGFLNNVIGGQYLNGNPYMQHVIDASANDIRNNVGSMFEGAGRYGSVANQGELGKQIGNMSSQLRYGDYNSQLDRMMSASDQANQQNNANQQQQLATATTAAQLPYTGSTAMADSLGALFNGGTSTGKSTQTGPSPIWGALGAGLGAAGSIFQGAGSFCDVRLKQNLRLDHVEPDGLPVYRFEYKPGLGLPEGEHVNPLAQDVAILRPHALGPTVGGYMTIYPGKL